MNRQKLYHEAVMIHSNAMNSLSDKEFDILGKMADECIRAHETGNKIILAGNGGSCADSQHLAAELVVRLNPARTRRALPALALTADTAILTACGNDFGFDYVFSRQIDALGRSGDVLLLLSTSGNSKNLLEAAFCAKDRGIKVLSMTGQKPNSLENHSDICLKIPSDNTATIQELQIFVGHLLCEMIEKEICYGS